MKRSWRAKEKKANASRERQWVRARTLPRLQCNENDHKNVKTWNGQKVMHFKQFTSRGVCVYMCANCGRDRARAHDAKGRSKWKKLSSIPMKLCVMRESEAIPRKCIRRTAWIVRMTVEFNCVQKFSFCVQKRNSDRSSSSANLEPNNNHAKTTLTARKRSNASVRNKTSWMNVCSTNIEHSRHRICTHVHVVVCARVRWVCVSAASHDLTKFNSHNAAFGKTLPRWNGCNCNYAYFWKHSRVLCYGGACRWRIPCARTISQFIYYCVCVACVVRMCVCDADDDDVCRFSDFSANREHT